jgi:hypothetical protein
VARCHRSQQVQSLLANLGPRLRVLLRQRLRWNPKNPGPKQSPRKGRAKIRTLL